MAVFILVPIVAPTLGAGIVAVSSWRWVFGVCVICAVGITAWTIRMPETLHAEYRLETSLARLLEAGRVVVSNWITVGVDRLRRLRPARPGAGTVGGGRTNATARRRAPRHVT